MVLTYTGRTGFKIGVPRPSRNGSKRNTKRNEQQRNLALSLPQQTKALQAYHWSLPTKVSAGMRSPLLLVSLALKQPMLLVMEIVQTMIPPRRTMRMIRLQRKIYLTPLRLPMTCTPHYPSTSHRQKPPTLAMLSAIKITPTWRTG